MNCHDYIDALVDLARGVDDASPMRSAAEAHARKCPRCAARLQHEREISAALRGLAGVASMFGPRDMEAKLIAAFDDHHRQRTTPQFVVQRWWPVAAAIVLAAAIGLAWTRSATPTDVAQQPVAAEAPAAAPQAPATASNIEQSAPTAALPQTETNAPGTRAQRGTRATRSNRSAGNAAVDEVMAQLAEFVALPGATALPPLERIEIVRIDVPLTGLPAYGLDIVPDARPTMIPADFLIGQDGVPRAIRLASDRTQ